MLCCAGAEWRSSSLPWHGSSARPPSAAPLPLLSSAGEDVAVSELLRFSKLFNDELTLDNLER